MKYLTVSSRAWSLFIYSCFFFIFLALYATCSVGIIYCVHFAKKQMQRVPKEGIFYCGESGPLRCRAGGFLSTVDLCQRPVGEPLWHIRTICLQRALATPAKANQEYRHGFASAEINPSAASSVVVGMWKCHPLLIKAMLLQRPG